LPKKRVGEMQRATSGFFFQAIAYRRTNRYSANEAVNDHHVPQGFAMSSKGKPSGSKPLSTSHALVKAPDQSQLDFEIDFFAGILDRHPEYVDVLRVQGNNLTLKGRYAEGLHIDKRLIQLRPSDPLVHYNLACSFALLKRTDSALKTLRRAIELGYRDFRYMREDRDLDGVRHDPRFRQLLREYENHG
jgi:tetratricopeptide (TPR) repeat protein